MIFGIIITLVMEMSLITPPVGVNVFVLSGVAKDVPMETIFNLQGGTPLLDGNACLYCFSNGFSPNRTVSA